MTASEQVKLMDELLFNLRRGLIKRAPQIPEHWDGFEIRQWISDYFIEHYVMEMEGKRRKGYVNEVILRELT
jgi:hypothetical protein